jgi:hypothetical protein
MCKTVIYKWLCLRCDWKYRHEISQLVCSEVTNGGGLLIHGACGIDELVEVTKRKGLCGPCTNRRKRKHKRY